jgi:hypothetical protein
MSSRVLTIFNIFSSITSIVEMYESDDEEDGEYCKYDGKYDGNTPIFIPTKIPTLNNNIIKIPNITKMSMPTPPCAPTPINTEHRIFSDLFKEAFRDVTPDPPRYIASQLDDLMEIDMIEADATNSYEKYEKNEKNEKYEKNENTRLDNNRRPTCKYFSRGLKCPYERCKFDHVIREPLVGPRLRDSGQYCRQWQQHMCHRGDQCRYSHAIPNKRTRICIRNQEGTCPNDPERCFYSHS